MTRCPVCRKRGRRLLEVNISIYKHEPKKRDYMVSAGGPSAIICEPCLRRMSFDEVASECEEQGR